MIEPAPHLNVPLDLSEIDEAQEAAQAWAVKLAQMCYAEADDIANKLDQWASHWKPEHVPALDRLLVQLININMELQADGHDK